MPRKYLKIFILIISYFISSCSLIDDQVIDQPVPSETPPVPSATATEIPEPTATIPPTITSTPTITPIVILDPSPQEIEFTADDGQVLSGIYYPADSNPAPLMILMHWLRGDQEEWTEIALWLQNRSELVRTADYNKSWKSSVWYPENTSGISISVFTFTFRECAGGCQNYLPTEWLLDIQAAITTAVGLTGVDRSTIMTAGASIGADGAINGCAWLNQSGLGKCRGAFALSPGSLLLVPFENAALELLQNAPPIPVYCLYGLRDDASVETCSAVPDAKLVDYGYIDNHGFELLQPLKGPDPLILLLEFINSALPE
jgi:dienelactone hydrolase